MLGFMPDQYRHVQSDAEERWLHGDESCRPANVQHVGPQVPEDMPLARIGPGGDYTRDIDAATPYSRFPSIALIIGIAAILAALVISLTVKP